MDATTQTDDHSSDSETGILIYSSHANLPKKMTLKERKQVVKKLPNCIQEEIAAIFIDSAAYTQVAAIFIDSAAYTQVSTITLQGMQSLQSKLYPLQSQTNIGYALAAASEVQPYALPLTKIYNNKHVIDLYKASLIAAFDTRQRYNCPKCKCSYATPSALGRHTTDKHSPQPKDPPLKDNHRTKGLPPRETYRPPILDEQNCPFNYHVFWQLTAASRRLPPSNRRNHRFVAPRLPLTMLQLAEQVNFPDLLSKEFVAFAEAYDTIVRSANFASIDTVLQCPIGVMNAKQDLVISGRIKLLKDIARQAPVLPTKNLKLLTDDTIVQFFAQARIHMLENSIPWDDFPAYYLSSAVLGAEISSKVLQVLHGYPEKIRPILRNFSCFIQHIINGLLPVQESYSEASLRILKNHRQHFLGCNPSAEYTITHIQADAQDLTRKSPYFKQVCTDITDEQHTAMIEKHKTNLLHSIIADTTYEATVHEILIGSSKYKEITEVPNQELLETLQRVIVAEEKSAIVLSNESSVLLPPTDINRPPPAYINTPPPNFSHRNRPTYVNTPPPNFSHRNRSTYINTPPPNFSHRPPNHT